MTETTITDAIVWPEDEGTGAPVAEDEGDWASAAYHASMARARGATGYVDAGVGLSYNPSDTTMDIGAGLVFIRYTGSSTVQLTSSSYDEPWDEELVFMVSVPAVSNLSLDADAVNEIYIAADPTGGDSARYRYGSSVTEPTDPHVKIGEIDTAAETTTELARRPVGEFASVETAELRGVESLTGPISSDTAITGFEGSYLFINASGSLSVAGTSMMTDVLDDGTETVSNTTILNFGSNLSVTDPGDGSATIDAIDSTTSSDIVHDDTQGGTAPDAHHNQNHDNTDHTETYAVGDYEIQVDGIDGEGIINFHTQ